MSSCELSFRFIDHYFCQLANLGDDTPCAGRSHLLSRSNTYEVEHKACALVHRCLQQELSKVRRHGKQAVLTALLCFRVNPKSRVPPSQIDRKRRIGFPRKAE